jgi:hypothetical protein
MIYPSWWGEDSDFEKEILKQRDKKLNHKVAKNNKEDSLDKRLRDAEDNRKR